MCVSRFAVALMCGSVVLACAATVQADILSDSPHAMGGNRLYVGNLSYHVDSFFDVFVELDMTMGGPPQGPPPPSPPPPPPPTPPSMDGVVILNASLPGGTPAPSSHPFAMSFFDVFTELSPSGSTAFYDTEMLSLNIEGVNPILGPFRIRESPTFPSLGRYSVEETMPGGPYHIDSFFDVFTELSIDGGQTWTPSDGSSHLRIVPFPEPTTLVLAALGGCALIGRRRSRL